MVGMGRDIDKLYDEIKIKSKKNNPKLEIYNIGKDKANIVIKNKLKIVRSAYNEKLFR